MRTLLIEATSLLIALNVCCGCAAHRTAVDQHYRLVTIGETDFLLPPDFSPKAEDAVETSVPLGGLGKSTRAGETAKCSIRDQWFSLNRDGIGKNWVAQVPAPNAWYSDDLVSHGHEEWNHFLAEIHDLESKGCITPEGYETATSWVRESLPIPVIFASLFKGTLDGRGFVNLKPGIRLVVERSVYRPASSTAISDYVGEMKVYYGVVRRHGNEIGLERNGIQRSAGLSSVPHEGVPDTKVADTFHKVGVLRLFLLTWYVPSGLHRTALLVGVRNPVDMVEIAQRIEKMPDIPCNDLANSDVACLSFGGADSANSAGVELNIKVNGRDEYFAVNSTVASVLNSLPPEEQAEAWRTLRIRRLFRDQYHDLEFPREGPSVSVSSLVLFAGDEISWRSTSVQ
jgi:hypothetical protein